MSHSTPQKAISVEVRADLRRSAEAATKTPRIQVPAFYAAAPKQKGGFSNIERSEMTSNDLAALGEALLGPAPAPNEKLRAAMKKAKEWFK